MDKIEEGLSVYNQGEVDDTEITHALQSIRTLEYKLAHMGQKIIAERN